MVIYILLMKPLNNIKTEFEGNKVVKKRERERG